MLNDGNTLYRREKYQDAAHRYLYAVRRVPENFDTMEDTKETFEQLKIHPHLNFSGCSQILGLLSEAVNFANSLHKIPQLLKNNDSSMELYCEFPLVDNF